MSRQAILPGSNDHSIEATENGEAAGFLAKVGKRVKAVRQERGVTRKALSELSGISERYLARLEGGTGNISIALLYRIALGLNCTLSELMENDSSVDDLVSSYKRARPEIRSQVDLLLNLKDALARKAKRICLIGLRGAGKSTLGKLLGADMGLPFLELNKEIENEGGMPVDEIIALYGQEGYRRLEYQALERIAASKDALVLAVAGGIVSDPEAYAYALEHFHTVWLKASPEEHMERVRARQIHVDIGGQATQQQAQWFQVPARATQRDPGQLQTGKLAAPQGSRGTACPQSGRAQKVSGQACGYVTQQEKYKAGNAGGEQQLATGHR